MSFQKVVASRYADFVSLRDVIEAISVKYKCSEEQARLVLVEAVSSGDEMPYFFRESTLGPKPLDNCDISQVYKRLTSTYRQASEELLDEVPF